MMTTLAQHRELLSLLLDWLLTGIALGALLGLWQCVRQTRRVLRAQRHRRH